VYRGTFISRLRLKFTVELFCSHYSCASDVQCATAIAKSRCPLISSRASKAERRIDERDRIKELPRKGHVIHLAKVNWNVNS